MLLLLLAALVAGLLGAPSAAVAQDRPWLDRSLPPDERARLLAAAMTFDQKIDLLSPEPLVAIPELGIPARREIDGPTGVTTAPAYGSTPELPSGTRTTSFPAGLSVASTWDPGLARALGRNGAREARLTGYTGWAAPAADMLRTPFFGRQWASVGEDPVLGGVAAAGVVSGINEVPGVYALPKHWLVNTQETQRRTLDNLVGERALRELYVRQWEPVLAEGPGAVMCAFPRLNGEFACENEKLLTGILKEDLGFRGWVSSDFNACYSFAAYRAGTDACGPSFPTRDALRQAVVDGTIPAARFDDMVHRVLRTFFVRGLIDDPPPGSLVNPRPPADPLPADVVAQSREVAYRIAVDGSVLLRNRAGALPLDEGDTGSIAVIGEGADRYITGFGADVVRSPTTIVPILDGIRARAGAGVEVTHTDGTDAARVADLMPGEQPVPSSVLRPASGTGSGLTAQWYPNPVFGGPAIATRVEDQVNWGQGLAAILNLFGAEPSPAPKLPQPFLGIPNPSVRWTGSLEPTVTGRYRLGFTVLGSVRLYVDDRLVLEEDANRITTVSVPVDLRAGRSRSIRIEYVADAPEQCCPASQNLGPALRFSWTPPRATASPQVEAGVRAARRADVAVVVANDYLGESLDRGHLRLPQGQDRLISAVARANPNTIVVLTTGGAVEMPWLRDVAGVLEAWYPGQEQGRAVAALLFGDEVPTGRLPLTWPRSERQVTAGLGIENPYPDVNVPDIEVPHDEGIFVGYRGYDRAGLRPLFPFGYGLSYDAVRIRDLRVRDARLAAPGRPASGRDGLIRVLVQARGAPTSTTVQVYAGRLPTGVATPRRQLIGWAEVELTSTRPRWVDVPVRLETPEHLLAYWDVRRDTWVTPAGRTRLYVGTSSRDIGVTGSITVRPARGRG